MAVRTTPQGSARGTKAAQRKRLKKIHVAPANGGFIVTHHHQPEYGGTPPTEKHVFSDYDSMHAHLEKAMTSHRR